MFDPNNYHYEGSAKGFNADAWADAVIARPFALPKDVEKRRDLQKQLILLGYDQCLIIAAGLADGQGHVNLLELLDTNRLKLPPRTLGLKLATDEETSKKEAYQTAIRELEPLLVHKRGALRLVKLIQAYVAELEAAAPILEAPKAADRIDLIPTGDISLERQQMDEQWVKGVKDNFEEWSGGFPPESDAQITVYIDYAASAEDDPDQLRKLLREWMNETE